MNRAGEIPGLLHPSAFILHPSIRRCPECGRVAVAADDTEIRNNV